MEKLLEKGEGIDGEEMGSEEEGVWKEWFEEYCGSCRGEIEGLEDVGISKW